MDETLCWRPGYLIHHLRHCRSISLPVNNVFFLMVTQSIWRKPPKEWVFSESQDATNFRLVRQQNSLRFMQVEGHFTLAFDHFGMMRLWCHGSLRPILLHWRSRLSRGVFWSSWIRTQEGLSWPRPSLPPLHVFFGLLVDHQMGGSGGSEWKAGGTCFGTQAYKAYKALSFVC